jgi:hypothetical protein
MSKKKLTKAEEIVRLQQLIGGSQKHYTNGSQPLPVGGAALTAAQATQKLQGFLAVREDVGTAKATLQSKRDAERAKRAEETAFVDAFESVIRGTFGTEADVLADFGLAPPKTRAPLTAEKKLVAAVKRKATRTARHTMGSKQRKDIKGAVSGVVVTTVSDPQTTTTSPPAATTPTGTTPPHA